MECCVEVAVAGCGWHAPGVGTGSAAAHHAKVVVAAAYGSGQEGTSRIRAVQLPPLTLHPAGQHVPAPAGAEPCSGPARQQLQPRHHAAQPH
ncbi:hypothetical protein HaLaN_25144 [Haematococcus lacustris]|uniref:Uncharacterized protein n=1 Tax=Haematococcus lacustris TaxID=44745 RepID=A0A6A0A4Z6_HAELA|nr:hypothetical protein HaLaN_25144 [Haematococcus lacustris]